MTRHYSNTAQETQLQASINAASTTISVGGTAGFPTSTPYTLVLDADVSGEEIVTVTAVSGTNLTVTRGEDGTTATDHAAGAVVRHFHTARDFRESRAHEDATSGVHGVTGPLVGTDNAQALANKDLSSPTNTFGPTAANDVGDIKMTARSTAPSGWLLCDGSAVSRTTYEALFAAIGTAFGPGDGATTFNLPDLRDRFPVGVGGSKALGSAGGAFSQTLTKANIPPHVHDISHDHGPTSTDGTHDHDLSLAMGDGTFAGNVRTGRLSTDVTDARAVSSAGAHTHDVPQHFGDSGDGAAGGLGTTAVDITNPHQAVNFVIKH